MNTILINFSIYNLPVVDLLVENHWIDYLFFVSETEYSSQRDLKVINFNHNDFLYGNFYDSINLSSFPPIEQFILDDLSMHEHNFISMIKRFRPNSTYEANYQEYLSTIRFWNYYIVEFKIDSLVSLVVPHSGFDYVIYVLCKYYNIQTVILQTMPSIKNKTFLMYTISDFKLQDYKMAKDYNQLLNCENSKSNNISSEVREYINYSNGDYNTITGAKEFNISSVKILINWFSNPGKTLYKLLKYLRFRGNYNIFKIRDKVDILKRNFILDYEINKLNKYYKSLAVKPNLESDFIYFPLSYQPEMSTLPLAGRYSELSIIVSMISNHMPKGTILYIKEHPRYSKNRDGRFYNKILENQNVLLIERSFSSAQLVTNSKCVITTTGSVALEAHINKKPVVMFGDRIFKHMSGVYRVNTSSDLKNCFDEIFLNDKVITDEDIHKSLRLIDIACLKCSYTSVFKDYHNFSDDDNNLNLYNLISRGLN